MSVNDIVKTDPNHSGDLSLDHEHLLRHRSAKERTDDDCLKAAETVTLNDLDASSTFLTPVIWCILVTETAERFAYYGFRAILVLYFTMELDYSENAAIALYGYNSSLAYFTPLLGACLADGYIGRYRTILSFGSIYVVGLAVLATAASSSDESDLFYKRVGSFAGLFLVCLGTGGIKPCVSAFGADQVALPAGHDNANNGDTNESAATRVMDLREAALVDERQRSEQVRTFFNYFYFCINVGAVTSIAIVPLLRGSVGFGWAFGVPCAFMVTTLFIFQSKRHEYVHQTVNSDGGNMLTTLRITRWLLLQQIYSHRWIAENCRCFRPGPAPVPSTDHSDAAIGRDSTERNGDIKADEQYDAMWKQQMDDAAQALHALPVLAMFPIYWCLYDQQGSVWTLQATRMELPAGVQPEQLNIVNPLQIMIFIPLFDRVIYPYLERRRWNISPLRRMSWGMLLTAAAFLVSGLVESAIEHQQERGLPKVHVFWQLPQITVLAVGEIFLSVTGLEFAYATSPDRLKAFVTALFLGTTGIGDCLAGILYSTIFANMNRAVVLYVCAALMIGNLRLFLWVARWYEDREFQPVRQEEEAQAPSSEGMSMELRQLRGEVV